MASTPSLTTLSTPSATQQTQPHRLHPLRPKAYINREKSKDIRITDTGTDANGTAFERGFVVVESGGCVLVTAVAGPIDVEDALEGNRIFHVMFTLVCCVSMRRPTPIAVVDTVNSNVWPDWRLLMDRVVELCEDHRC
jgi:hypothetical protein